MNKNVKRSNNTGTVLFEQNTVCDVRAEREHLLSVRQAFPGKPELMGACLFISGCDSVVLSLRELSEKRVLCGSSLCALDSCLRVTAECND